jgi:hypothetical protein
MHFLSFPSVDAYFNFLQDLKSFVVAQYSTHFEEIKTILEVKKAVNDLGVSFHSLLYHPLFRQIFHFQTYKTHIICFTQEMKTLVVDTCSTKLDELKSAVLDQQKSIENIHGSLKLIEVVMCTKTGDDNPNKTVVGQATDMADATAVDARNDKDAEHVNVGNGKRKFVYNEYESELDKEKELANIDLTFTDEDDDDIVNTVINKTVSQTASQFHFGNKHNSPKPVLPAAWKNSEAIKNTTDLSNGMACATSSFRRVGNNAMEVDAEALNQISKKLVFQSPCTTPKIPTQGKKGSSSSKGKKTMSASVSKRTRMVLPRGIKWNFAVTAEMQLDLTELQALAYIYHPDKDKQ